MAKSSYMIPVYVEWLDHASAQGWIDVAELEDDEHPPLYPIKNYTFGFVVYETKEALYISHTLTGHGMCCDPIVILKSLITTRKKVK